MTSKIAASIVFLQLFFDVTSITIDCDTDHLFQSTFRLKYTYSYIRGRQVFERNRSSVTAP